MIPRHLNRIPARVRAAHAAGNDVNGSEERLPDVTVVFLPLRREHQRFRYQQRDDLNRVTQIGHVVRREGVARYHRDRLGGWCWSRDGRGLLLALLADLGGLGALGGFLSHAAPPIRLHTPTQARR